jgi:hypothetical protein
MPAANAQQSELTQLAILSSHWSPPTALPTAAISIAEAVGGAVEGDYMCVCVCVCKMVPTYCTRPSRKPCALRLKLSINKLWSLIPAGIHTESVRTQERRWQRRAPWSFIAIFNAQKLRYHAPSPPAPRRASTCRARAAGKRGGVQRPGGGGRLHVHAEGGSERGHQNR